MSTITVTVADRGRSIAANGTLKAVRFMKAPTFDTLVAYPGGLFGLADMTNSARTIFQADVSVQWWTTPNPIYSNEIFTGSVPFGDLTVTKVPNGSIFEIDVV